MCVFVLQYLNTPLMEGPPDLSSEEGKDSDKQDDKSELLDYKK